MDPNRGPSRSRNYRFAQSGPSSSPARAADSSPSRSPRNLSPAPSAISRQPLTPDAIPETASDYFNPATFAQSSSTRPPALFTNSATPERPAVERDRQPSIRIRRSAASSLRSRADSGAEPFPSFDGDYSSAYNDTTTGRPRSISQPERTHVAVPDPALARHSRRGPQIALPRLTEEGSRPTMAELGYPGSPLSPSRSLPGSINFPEPCTESQDFAQERKGLPKRSMVSRMLWPNHFRRQPQTSQTIGPPPVLPNADTRQQDEYDEELVDWLDIIDPEVQTLSTLTNVQNSLFIPDLGNWVNRRPTYVLSEHNVNPQVAQLPRERRRLSDAQRYALQREETVQPSEADEIAPVLQRSSTITSRLTDSHYAALPHGESLEGWTAEEKMQLDDHVRHMLHSRRSRLKRSFKGFGQYVRRPLGFFVTLYATLITLFGLAWVLFLIGWIYVGEKQPYVIHVIDSVLVALFAIMGDGLAPFRAVDTYHMFFIARYTRMINNAKKGKPPRTRLKKRNVPPDVREILNTSAQTDRTELSDLQAVGDLNGQPGTSPDQTDDQNADVEDAKAGDQEAARAYLTYAQAKSLAHHQKKLAKSHSFYKPKETFTHHAFPLSYLIAIVVLLDCHSCLQISLGATTWGIDWRTRPIAITTVILCVSITCNITAGLLISIGDRKTRKKDVIELLNRQELTSDAIKLVQEQREKEDESPVEKDKEKKEKDRAKLEKKLIKEPSSGSS